MSSPCNSLNVQTLKISNLSVISGRSATGNKIKPNDLFLLIQNGTTDAPASSNYFSRKSKFSDILVFLASSPSGSYSGSFSGSVNGHFSGSAKGHFSGSFTGSAKGKFIGQFGGGFSGSFSGSCKGYISASAAYNLKAAFHGTASWALNANNAKLATNATSALSASYASASRSSSYLKYVVGKNNGTASFAVKAATANTASFLQYNGHFNGSASYARSASVARSSSYALSASYAKSSINSAGFGGLPAAVYVTATSPLTMDHYLGTYYAVSHGFGAAPSLTRITGVCQSTNLGYNPGDEIDIEYLQLVDNNWDRLVSSTWSDSSQVGISFTADTHDWQFIGKLGVGPGAIDRTKWKLIIRAWK